MAYWASIGWDPDDVADVDRITVLWRDDNGPLVTGITDQTLVIEIPGGTVYVDIDDTDLDDAGDHVFVYEHSGTRLPEGQGLVATVTITHSAATRTDRVPLSSALR